MGQWPERLRARAFEFPTTFPRGAIADVLLAYQTVILTDTRRTYRAWACGGETGDGTHRWHGWIEFLPLDGGRPVRTARETTQPNRDATVYWSTGLSPVYLEGALRRALSPPRIQSANCACPRADGRIDGKAKSRLVAASVKNLLGDQGLRGQMRILNAPPTPRADAAWLTRRAGGEL